MSTHQEPTDLKPEENAGPLAQLRQPNDRDESTTSQGADKNTEVIEQAAKDLSKGLRDTDKRSATEPHEDYVVHGKR